MERTAEMTERPKLRYVDAIPVTTEQGDMIALRDPSGLAEEVVVVSREALAILYFFDGQHTVAQIVEKCQRLYGYQVSAEAIENLIQHLDSYYYLENDHSRRRRKDLEQEILQAPYRPPAHAGVSYPAEKDELARRLREFFVAETGAGEPGKQNGVAAPAGVIAPHIDLRIGGTTYTHAYKRLAEAAPADVYVIIGTGHAGLSNLYSVLPVDFKTPLGTVPVDTQFIKKLESRYPHELYSDLLLHKTEHTIEFQVVFLQQIFGDRPFQIVPILSGFSYHIFTHPRLERERRIVRDFTQALRGTIENYPGRVTVIASVDLAHVGPRYGDNSPIDEAFLRKVEEADKKALAEVLEVDAAGWYKSIANVEDQFRICGFGPIYTLLASINASRGELLRYEQGLMDDNKSFVSYCSAVFY